MFDLLIRSADIVDGTGKPAFRADLAVQDGKIVEIGIIPPEVKAASTLDARFPTTQSPNHLITQSPNRPTTDSSRLVLSPGFIDIHTHADIALLARPDHLPAVMQGVTTEVFTNCGLGFAPVTQEGLAIQRAYLLGLFGSDAGIAWDWRSVADLLARYEVRGTAVNIAYLIPHGALRVSVMGMAARVATETEIEAMVQMVGEGMEQGAWGLSTGLWYAPMCHANRTEIVALCRKARFFATHQREYGEHLFEAAQESLAIAREAGVPVQIAHLQMNGSCNAGRAPELLAVLETAQAGGVDVACDSYPYTAGSTLVQTLLPAWLTDGGPEVILSRLAKADTSERILAALEALPLDWSRFTLAGATSTANGVLEGQSFAAAAATRGMTVPEWICALLQEDNLHACFVHDDAHEGNVRDILRWPGHMVGSDGLHLPGRCHPRLYGTFPRILGHYVREEKTLTLEEAVRKMTSAPAARLGLKDQGIIALGKAADLVLFDPASVQDTATYEDPLRFPEGIPHVFVNGVAVKRDGRPTYALPGRVLRRA